jgi:hypothetical protein
MINPLNNPAFLKVTAYLKAMTPKATGNKNLGLVTGGTAIQLHLQQKGGEIIESNDGVKGFLFTGYALQNFFLQKPKLDSSFLVSDVNHSGTYQIVSVTDLKANKLIVPIYRFELIQINK